jgi:glycosyltransferase involved in cell wall biosynthesis
MKIAAVCCTYLRPKALGRLIYCFLQQDYPARELIVLDDAAQYDNQRGDRWRLISVDQRFATLGEKRNAAATLLGDDVDALAVWDDDDLYLPWALRASVAALNEAAWSRPSLVLHPADDGALQQHETGGLFHGGWAYRREAFERAGRYPAKNNGEDQALARRFERIGATTADPCRLGFAPFYVYCWGGWHLSGMHGDGYRRLGGLRMEKTRLEIAPPEVDLRRPAIRPEVRPRRF